MSKEQLIEKLLELAELNADQEASHLKADDLLLEYIDDERVTEAFENIEKWYA